MQKTLDFLEKNVQWLALGLGGIVLLWSVYRYVVTPVATVKIGSAELGPGQVAEATAQGPAKQISAALADNRKVSFPSPDVIVALNTAMSNPVPREALASVPSWAMGISVGDHNLGVPTPGPADVVGWRMASLPQLPAAEPQSALAGLSVVQEPPPAAAQENALLPAKQQRKANAGAQPVLKTEDLPWASVFFKVPSEALTKSFSTPLQGHPLGPDLYSTVMLQVVLERQRAIGVDENNQPVFPPGEQGIETPIPPLKMYKGKILDFPDDASAMPKKYEYLEWARQNPNLVYEPEFYTIVTGDPWHTPEDQSNAADTTNGATTQPADGTPTSAPADSTEQPKPSAALPWRSAPYVVTVAAAPDPRMSLAQAVPPSRYLPGRYRGRGGYYRGGRAMPQQPGAFNNNSFSNANEGQIDPLNPADDIQIWCHDDTVRPGQTYRYRIIYKMKNPVFAIANLGAKDLIDQFALVSPPSSWSQAVAVPAKTKFWLASIYRDNKGSDVAALDEFRWVGGVWKRSKPVVAPGDLIPGTDWSLVDIRGFDTSRTTPRYVILTSDAGELAKRELQTDQQSADYKDMKSADEANNPENTQNQQAPPPTRTLPPRGRGVLPGYRGAGGRR